MILLAAFLIIICQSGIAKLSDLDRIVANYADYEQVKLAEIDSCKALLKNYPPKSCRSCTAGFKICITDSKSTLLLFMPIAA